jgi:hypothetical protein
MTTDKLRDWMPDFFIVGAMKSGTTSLHHLLDLHPKVFIPEHEIFFFDIDDVEQHPDFFFHEGSGWKFVEFEADLDSLLRWYQSHFDGAGHDQLIGEDSTTYLAARHAPERIARFNPGAKIVAILRDPVARAYSEYWYLVRWSKAFFDFEDTLRHWPGLVVTRSMYQRQVEQYLKWFPREQLHFVLLEELVAHPDVVISELCRFLDLSPEPLRGSLLHSNKGRVARHPRLHLLRNRLVWRHESQFWLRLMSEPLGFEDKQKALLVTRAFNHLHRRTNRLTQTPPPMRPDTRRFLTRYFAVSNSELGALIDKDLDRYWAWDGSDASDVEVVAQAD